MKGNWPILDIGVVKQNILLAAREQGLGTSSALAIIHYLDEITKIAGVHDSKRIIIGITMGYPDWERSINPSRANREKIDHFVTLVGPLHLWPSV